MLGEEVRGARVLLLQGPNGPFFRRLFDELVLAGASVTKVNLNAAEELYFLGRPSRSFRGALEDFPAYLEALDSEERFDLCFLFGDCRPYHLAARPVLDERGIETFVFEDGYLRPDFVTIERGGVNGRSAIRGAPPDLEAVDTSEPPWVKVRQAFEWSVLHTIINSLGVTCGAWRFPQYRHHRDVQTARQALLWGRSGVRRVVYGFREGHLLAKVRGPLHRRYFLAGLQVHNDSQVKCSRFGDVRDFIEEVVSSFARFADTGDTLVFKHHPADRAYRDYGALVSELARSFGLGERLIYVHDVHLPTLLRHAKGTIVINSTVGWSSLHHGTPVLALGDSVYGFMGLAASGPLDEFWQSPPAVDATRVAAAERWLRRNNQANGSVWVPIPNRGPTGLGWPPELRLSGRRRVSVEKGVGLRDVQEEPPHVPS